MLGNTLLEDGPLSVKGIAGAILVVPGLILLRRRFHIGVTVFLVISFLLLFNMIELGLPSNTRYSAGLKLNSHDVLKLDPTQLPLFLLLFFFAKKEHKLSFNDLPGVKEEK